MNTSTTTNPDSDSDLRLAIQPYSAPAPAATPSTSIIMMDDNCKTNPRKRRRSKLDTIRPPPPMTENNNPRKRRMGPTSTRFEVPKPCTECGKMFDSPKALYGHMRCHPERPWRGINPPPNRLRLGADEADAAEALLKLAYSSPPLPYYYSVFECSSCNKVFGSHQALGGHRASHKNVKGCFALSDDVVSASASASASASQPNNDSNQHRCDICMRIFSSGQALGGHKRCHWLDQRGLFSGGAADEVEAINVQPLAVIRGGFDLNLPPLEDYDEINYASNSSNSRSISLDLRLGR